MDETVALLRRNANDAMPYRVRRANGTTLRYTEFLEAERIAYQARFGALSPKVRMRIAGAPPSAKFPVAIYFEIDGSWTDLEPRLHSRTAGIRDVARSDLRASIVRSGAALSASLAAAGIPIRRRMEAMPVAFAELTPAQVHALARNPRVSSVRMNDPGAGHRDFNQRDLVGTPNTVSYVATETEFNALGYYARNQKVGIVESAECRLYSEHDAFQFLGAPSGPKVTYEVNARPCASDKECDVCNGYDPEFYPRCIAGQCVVDHASSVASVIAASNDGERHAAAEAKLYYPNRGYQGVGESYPNVFCSLEGVTDAYDWMQSQGVTTVNESFGCESKYLDGQAQDYFARTYGMSITKSAGNDGTQPACPDTLNALCVGSTIIPSDYAFSAQNWRNPWETDREEPDIMALGAGQGPLNEGPTVATIAGSNLWEDYGGTSLAAPAVASQIALLKDACGGAGLGGDLDDRYVRAVVEAAAYYINPQQDDGFSIPGTGDWRDGAGVAGGAQLLDFCGIPRTGNTASADSKSVNIWSDGDPLDGTWGFPKDPPPGGFRGLELGTMKLKVGEYLRAVLAWDACTSPGGTAAFVKTDFDLVLTNKGNGSLITYSASYMDNDEGFQVQIPEDGTYALTVLWPNNSGSPAGLMEAPRLTWPRSGGETLGSAARDARADGDGTRTVDGVPRGLPRRPSETHRPCAPPLCSTRCSESSSPASPAQSSRRRA